MESFVAILVYLDQHQMQSLLHWQLKIIHGQLIQLASEISVALSEAVHRQLQRDFV